MIENGQPDGGYVLCIDQKKIPFRVDHRRRKTLAISVHPDQRLEVIAPVGSTSSEVLQRVEKRAGWILRQLRHFEQFRPTSTDRQYISGETHLYLGRQYRLKVSASSPEGVKLVGRFFHISTTDSEDRHQVQALMEHWYRRHAERVFENRLQACIRLCPSLRTQQRAKLLVRRMTRRWGSCTRAGKILLNLDLIKVPVHCVDYVIVHELCHLQVHSHSAAFYRLLSRIMPDWEKRKQRLEEFAP